jgi:peptidoglycan/LPS O-acetylase OafA/YrhL
MAVSKAQLPALTSIRFFAAIHVVFYHYARSLFTAAPGPARALLDNGFVGVSFFFVLSGFILAYTYEGACGRPGWARDFWVARLARVYPMYVAALAVTGILLATSHPHATRQAIAVSGVASLLLVQSWVPAWVGIWNIPGWSLSVEAIFYLAFPGVFPWLARRSGRELAWTVVAAVAAAVAVPLLYAWADPDGLGSSGVAAGDTTLLDAVKYEPVLHLPQFCVGVAYGCAFARRPVSAHGEGLARASVVLGAVTLVALAVPYGRAYPLLHDGLLAPLFGGLIYCLAGDRGPIAAALKAPALVFLGRASYAIYLLQHPVWIAVPNALRRLGLAWSIGSLVITITCLLLASAVALLTIEEPGRRWVRRVLSAPIGRTKALEAPPV